MNLAFEIGKCLERVKQESESIAQLYGQLKQIMAPSAPPTVTSLSTSKATRTLNRGPKQATGPSAASAPGEQVASVLALIEAHNEKLKEAVKSLEATCVQGLSVAQPAPRPQAPSEPPPTPVPITSSSLNNLAALASQATGPRHPTVEIIVPPTPVDHKPRSILPESRPSQQAALPAAPATPVFNQSFSRIPDSPSCSLEELGFSSHALSLLSSRGTPAPAPGPAPAAVQPEPQRPKPVSVVPIVPVQISAPIATPTLPPTAAPVSIQPQPPKPAPLPSIEAPQVPQVEIQRVSAPKSEAEPLREVSNIAVRARQAPKVVCEDMNDSMVTQLQLIGKDEEKLVKVYLWAAISPDELNGAIRRLNDHNAAKFFEGSDSPIDQISDSAFTKVSKFTENKTKAALVILVQLKRLKMLADKSNSKVYKFLASSDST